MKSLIVGAAIAAAQQPSQILTQVNKDNFVHALNGVHDPVEINKYSRMSTQIRQYVAFDVFNNFRGLSAEPRGCHARSSGCTAFAGLEQIWGYGCHCYGLFQLNKFFTAVFTY